MLINMDSAIVDTMLLICAFAELATAVSLIPLDYGKPFTVNNNKSFNFTVMKNMYCVYFLYISMLDSKN